MKRRWFYLIFGLLFVQIVTTHFFRATVDSLTFKAGNGELVFYMIPGSFGAEYYPESYLDYIVKYKNWEYGGMPFIGSRPGADMTDTSYPMRFAGHLYFYSFNGPWPHKAIAVGIPAWILLLLFLVGFMGAPLI
jgi:hypothetical protein